VYTSILYFFKFRSGRSPFSSSIVLRRSKTSANLTASLNQALALLKNARSVVVLTGAGISTPSGIPDFRSDKTGLWSFTNPFEVATLWAFHDHPKRFYNWMRPLAKDILRARPNPAHFALTQMERMGKVTAIVTQNIDGLHQKARASKVMEIHGHLRSMSCLHCGHHDESAPYLDNFLQTGEQTTSIKSLWSVDSWAATTVSWGRASPKRMMSGFITLPQRGQRGGSPVCRKSSS